MTRTDIEDIPNMICTASEKDCIRAWKINHPGDTCTDEEALTSFMAVNWAWFVEDNYEG